MVRTMPRRKDHPVSRENVYIHRFLGKGWRVYIAHSGVLHDQTYFYDHNYGSSERAMEAARKHRDAVLKEKGIKHVIYNGNGHQTTNKKNEFGAAGVSICCTYDGDEPRCVIWIAKWTKDGEHYQKGFSIRKHGYINGWKKAWDVRSKMTGQTPPDEAPVPPIWLQLWMFKKGIKIDN